MAASTLFVKNLPTSATNGRLEEIFSEVGPVKHCFVVKEKGTDTCRGFGYVTFAMEEDAQRALTELQNYDGKKMSVVVAKKKPNNKKKAATKEPAPVDRKPKGLKKSQMKARLIIRNLSFKCSEEDLRQVYSEFGTVLDVNIPLKPDGKMRGFAFVQLKNVLQAGTALKATNLKEIKGRQVAVDWAVPKDKFVATQPPPSSGTNKQPEKKEEEKKAEEDSEEDEEDVEVPKTTGAKPAKQEVGRSAKPAKQEVGRVAKPVKQEVGPGVKPAKQEVGRVAKPAKQEVGRSAKPAKQEVGRGAKPAKQEVESGSGSEAESNEQDSDDDEDEEEEEAPEKADSDHSDGESDEDEDEDEDDDDDDDDSDDDGSDDDDDEERPVKKLLPSDVNEGKTVFIRNLSFDTDEEGLEEVLLQFGELKYIRIVLHHDTEHSKGCAFAQFKTKEAADRCLAVCQEQSEGGGLRVDGRVLNVVLAVSRDDAVKLKDKKTVKTETGTRNLYLAREGLIRAGTQAAEGVPEADMVKRARFEELKRVKLRDIQVFVSKLRLCVHNLPKSVDPKQLRALCLKASGGSKNVRITECRVMYDRKPEAGKVVGRSLGYGFVQFQTHEHALNTLRHLNNNPQIFGPQKRPIVEFSLEDGRKLKMKEMRSQQPPGGKPPVKTGVVQGVAPGAARQQQRGGGATVGAESKGGAQKGVAPGAVQGVAKDAARQQQRGGGATVGAGSKGGAQKGVAPGAVQGVAKGAARQQQRGGGATVGVESKAGAQKGVSVQYSGFRTTPEVEEVELADGKKRKRVLLFPSHRGPKNRKRDRGKAQPAPPAKNPGRPSRKERASTLQKQSQPRKQAARVPRKMLRNKEDQRFDSLVEQYKRRILGNPKAPATKKSKWFSS